MEAFASHFSGVKVIWYSGNQNVESILQNGSREADMHQLALLVIQISLEFHISLEVKWIPWELNAKADAISNLTDYDDYTINEAIFQRINLFWGPHTVDRFACFYNAKVPRFNTEIGYVVVDAFSQDWGHDNDWICPPVCLLIRVVKHMELCKARGTVILPLWKSSCFWTLFCRDGVQWNSFVIDWVFLPKFPGLFTRGKARNSLFGSRPLDFDAIALRIDFAAPDLPVPT